MPREFPEALTAVIRYLPTIWICAALILRSDQICRSPEYFLYRILYNYARAFEENALEDRLLCGARLRDVRLSAADYARIILRQGSDPLEMDLTVGRALMT